MTWLGWLLIIDLVLSCALKARRIGERITKDDVAFQILFSALYVLGILTVGVNR